MIKLIYFVVCILALFFIDFPEIKVVGAMRNIMMKGDLSAKLDLDTLNKTNLYGLGPVADLKGEILINDGQVFSSEKSSEKTINRQNQTTKAAMLVYSYVKKWKASIINVKVDNYVDLERKIEDMAKKRGINMDKPFVFKVSAVPQLVDYHIIDWENKVNHTMDNHKQFALNGSFKNSAVLILGFYSSKHHSIFTHHTTNMHLHVMDEKTKTVGHLEDIQLKGSITIYFPRQ